MKTETATFTAEVRDAICDCHKGQFAVVVYIVDPASGSAIPVGDRYFTTRKEAEENTTKVTEEIGRAVLAKYGIKDDQIRRTRLLEGEEALKYEELLKPAANQELH